MFHAHIGGMDAFARALVIADNMVQNSEYRKLRSERYNSFDTGKGKEYEEGNLSLEELSEYAIQNGEPQLRSGRQEYFENLINRYI